MIVLGMEPLGRAGRNGDQRFGSSLEGGEQDFDALLESESVERPTLRLGSRGEDVADAQGRFGARGFDPGVVDGIFGAQTAAAARAFQSSNGLAADGVVGPQTWAALLGTGPRPAPGPAPAPSDRWVLPADVRAAGEAQHVRYDSPPAWANGSNCSRIFTAGADDLKRHIQATFPGVSSIGGLSCRQNTANPAETSVHGVGRALDIMVPPVSGKGNAAVGDPIANWLVRNAQALGLQYLIWNRTKWSGSRSGRKDGVYGGPIPHIDHLHAELNLDGARRLTPWFRTRGG
jgi:hypothetical protein